MKLRLKSPVVRSLHRIKWTVKSEQAVVRTRVGVWHLTLAQDTSGTWTYRIHDDEWTLVGEGPQAWAKAVARKNAIQRLTNILMARTRRKS